MTALAGLCALIIALTLPVAYYTAARFRLTGALETSARLHAAEVSELARANPAFWDFDGLHVAAATPDGTDAGAQEIRRVYDTKERLVIEVAPDAPLDWPTLAVRAPVSDNGNQLGHAEASRSQRGVLIATGVVTVVSGLLSLLIFVGLRVVPLRLLHEALERASFLAAHDGLTGLANRSLFGQRLAQAMGSARREGHRVAVHCLDLDRFKEVNDTLGHAAGDTLLRTVATRLNACLRETDTLARLGGDEFAVIQVGLEGSDDAQNLAERLLSAVELPMMLEGQQADVGVSIGIALSEPGGHDDAEQMMKDADLALYKAKAAGRGGCCFFTPDMNARLVERRALEVDLREALAKKTLVLDYQPQFDLQTGKVVGAEALVRWNRPGHGLVPPEDFVSVAEQTGQIVELGAWVMREACREAASWPNAISIAVNVSPAQLHAPGFYDVIKSSLAAAGLDPRRLEVEITEGVLLRETADTLAILGRLHKDSIRIAMDDFGTGYSSLSYLQKFPFDKIKIDRSFIGRLGSDDNAAAIVRAVIGMGRALGVSVNAEGVESQAQAALLMAAGCNEVQGYYFGQPMSPKKFLESLTTIQQPA